MNGIVEERNLQRSKDRNNFYQKKLIKKTVLYNSRY